MNILANFKINSPAQPCLPPLPGGEFVIHQLLMFFKVFMLSPLKGGSGLKAKRNKSLLQSLGALVTSPCASKKSDRCFWGISPYESIPGMIPKSDARMCYLNESASFF
jgi:hypothetical protein